MKLLFYKISNSNLIKIHYIFIFLVFISVTGLNAENYNFKLKSDKDTVEVGDKIIIEVLAKLPKSSTNIFVSSEDTTDKYNLLKTLKLDTIFEKNSKLLRGRVEFYNYNLIDIDIQPFKIKYDLNDTNILLISNSLRIINKLQNADTSKAFKDIKTVVEVDFDYSEYIYYFILVVLILLVLYFIYKYINNKKPKEKILENITPQIPAHILALESLKALENEQLWQKGKTKDYYTKLSEILKIYVENYFKIDCLELTTNELITKMNFIDIDTNEVIQLKNILVTSDMVKFAKYEANSSENINVMTSSIEFVKNTSKLNSDIINNNNKINFDKNNNSNNNN